MVSPEERFRQAVELVLRHEGGYVNDPNDPGGETKYGISKRSYPYLNIRDLTREAAIEIYRSEWWDRYGYGHIEDAGVAAKVFDLAVHIGPDVAHRLLQQALIWLGHSVELDGKIGPQTIGATNAANPQRLLEALRHLAAMHYYRLVRQNRKLERFLMGWLNRAYA